MKRLYTCFRLAIILSVSSSFAIPAAALAADQDISLFSGAGTQPPNIMILLDTSGSMSWDHAGNSPCVAPCVQRIDTARTELISLLNTVNPLDTGTADPTDRIESARFGLFTYRHEGGLLNVEIASGSTDDVISGINSCTLDTAGVYGTPLSGAILDVGRYFAHQNSIWSSMSAWGTVDGAAIATDDEDPSDITTNPFDLSCRASHLIYLSDGSAYLDTIAPTNFWSTIGDADNDLGYTSSVLDGPLEETSANVSVACATYGTSLCMEWTDDIAKTMFETDFAPSLEGLQNIETSAIGFTIDHPGLSRMAAAGGGDYYTANNAAQLATALDAIVAGVFDPVASYSAAAVPSSRSTSGSAFFNAYFEPINGEAPWAGHLEMFGLSAAGVILGSDGNPAVDSGTDLLKVPHLFHWDAAAAIRTQTSRNLYTTRSNVIDDLADADDTDLGVAVADVADLLSWVRGIDVFDEDSDADVTEKRAIILADIFHSTPSIVASPTTMLLSEQNYLAFYVAKKDRKRVAYVGANDGMVHAFDAGDWVAAVSGVPAHYSNGNGEELFGYVPGSMLDDLDDLRTNTDHSLYGVDGSPTTADVWLASALDDTVKDVSEWKTVLLQGYRKGGDGYLALDITDPTATASTAYPKRLWEFSDANLGESWSKPVVTRVKVHNNSVTGDFCGADDGDTDCVERWVMIVGGGYDTKGDPNDFSYESSATRTKARSIYMVDLATGNILASVEYDAAHGMKQYLQYAMPSQPAVLDLDFDGFADVVYIGDLGGQMWKWDISQMGLDTVGDAKIDNWEVTIFFNRPKVTISATDYYFSFYSPPTATLEQGDLWLAFGSGDRTRLTATGVLSDATDNDRFYWVKDSDPTDWYVAGPPIVRPAVLTETDIDDVTSLRTDPDPANAGYFFVAEDGEKFLTDIVIFAGYVVATSYSPDYTGDICEQATGKAYTYIFKVANGLGKWDSGAASAKDARRQYLGGGLAASPQVSIGRSIGSDKIYVKSSKGRIITLTAPPRSNKDGNFLYWKQKH